MDARSRLLVGLATALGVGVVAFYVAGDDVEPTEHVESSESVRGQPARTEGSDSVRGRDTVRGWPARKEGSDSVRGRDAVRGRPARKEGADSVRDQTDATDPSKSDPTSGPALEDGDPRGWEDPTNDRVLGPKDWMAPTDPDERARIDEVFEKSRAARYDPRLSNHGRGESVAAIKAVVDACFEALQERSPAAAGRLIVAWTAAASDGQGRITNPRIKVNYQLEDEAFEGCVLDGAENLRFPASDGEAIEVEAPFFYDGAF